MIRIILISLLLLAGCNKENTDNQNETINNTDTLTLFIDQNDINKLGIKINNHGKNTETVYKLNLLGAI